MARDRQIFVRTTQEAYEWVIGQAEAAGLSIGALVSQILEMAARDGWVLEPPRVAVAGSPAKLATPVAAALEAQTGTVAPARKRKPPAERRDARAAASLVPQERPARAYDCCKHCKGRNHGGHNDPCLNGCHGEQA